MHAALLTSNRAYMKRPLSELREAHQQRLIDGYLSARSNFWAAVLTINGLLLTFFSDDAGARRAMNAASIARDFNTAAGWEVSPFNSIGLSGKVT